MKIFSILAISCQILVVSSSFGQKVSYDFDKNTNFEQFRTYKWVYIKGATTRLSEEQGIRSW